MIKQSGGFSWMLQPQQYETLRKIWKSIESFPNINIHKSDRITDQSAEIAFYDLYGEAYTSISFNSDKNAMYIDKYYESEFLQDEYGEVKYVPILWDNYEETVNTLKTIVDTWINNRKANKTINWYKQSMMQPKPSLTRQQIIERIKTWNDYLKQEKDLTMIHSIKDILETLHSTLSLIDSLLTNSQKVQLI